MSYSNHQKPYTMALLYFVLLLSFGFTLGHVLHGPETICPPSDIINPCTCSKSCPVCPAFIECAGILNTEELFEVFRKSEDWTFWHLIISHSTFQYIPSDTIVEKRVRNLYLRNNVMYALFDKPPPDPNQLQELELTDLILQGGVRWDVFSSLVHLKELNLTSFEIRKIDEEFVNNFPQGLNGLYFNNTKTKLLGDTAFAKLANLSRVFVRNTQIQTLKRSMFPPDSKLIAINFSGNQISSLPHDLFSNMPELRGVEFSNTNVVTLPESVFGKVMPQLGLFYLEGNAIDCNCEMKWIPKLKVLPYYLKVECTKPKNLEGISMKNLKESQFEHCE